jgi:hypothetical protein
MGQGLCVPESLLRSMLATPADLFTPVRFGAVKTLGASDAQKPSGKWGTWSLAVLAAHTMTRLLLAFIARNLWNLVAAVAGERALQPGDNVSK